MQSWPGAQSNWLLHCGLASAGVRQTPSTAQVGNRVSWAMHWLLVVQTNLHRLFTHVWPDAEQSLSAAHSTAGPLPGTHAPWLQVSPAAQLPASPPASLEPAPHAAAQ